MDKSLLELSTHIVSDIRAPSLEIASIRMSTTIIIYIYGRRPSPGPLLSGNEDSDRLDWNDTDYPSTSNGYILGCLGTL